jgi:NosR/NirI family transcriptional regulator, nitrous oxide reductase regulator
MKFSCLIATLLLVTISLGNADGESRFPIPEFESGYKYPPTSIPPVKEIPVVVDVSILAAVLSVTTWSVLRNRSRREVFLITLFSLAYFGFYRKGCVCSVGSLQNVVGALVDHSAGVPLVVLAFFFLPLLFALYFGRVFCASVCPLGAIQELAAVHPVQISRPVEAVLSLLPYAYLGLTVLSVMMGSGYLICRYDPFVGFFRQGASFNMLAAGGVLLLAGVIIARPYCRFLCPYGVVLSWVSRFSKWRVSITPSECVQCRLCETSCPYGAIVIPTPDESWGDRRTGTRRLGFILLACPAIVALAAWTGYYAHDVVARLHPTVSLAERVADEDQGLFTEHTIESDAFRAGKQSVSELYFEAAQIRDRFKYASALFGAFMGLVFCGKLIRLTIVRKGVDYEADRGACLSCARCYTYCPVEVKNADT